jgi:hypothetical protein
MVVVQYGATTPFTLGIIEDLVNEPLPPSYWKTITNACLSGGDYLLWKSEFQDQYLDQADRNCGTQQPFTADQLAGEDQWGSVQQQLNFPGEYYAQVNTLAEQAWRRLPSSGLKTEELSKIRQGPDEPYQDFVSWLLQAVGRLIIDGETKMILVKQLAFKNASTLYGIGQSQSPY